MIKLAEWFATTCGCIGALLVAQQTYILGYSVMLAGSIAWLTVSAIRRALPAAVQWGFFLCCNILGLYNLL